MASRTFLARTARQLNSCASVRPVTRAQWSCQRWERSPVQARLFTVSGALREKKYTEDHEWIEAGADGKTYTLGISTYAANALGDVVYIELPQVELDISAGDAIGAVESVKSASDILTPIGGKIAEVNSALEETPGKINKDPEGDGWIARIVVEGEPKGKLMSEGEYEKFTESVD